MKAREYSAALESATEPELLVAEEVWTALHSLVQTPVGVQFTEMI